MKKKALNQGKVNFLIRRHQLTKKKQKNKINVFILKIN
jgi:hypothetical protein